MNDISKIRKEVAHLANALNKKLKDLSKSFKRAWAMVKARKLIVKIAGTTYGNRQIALKRLESYIRQGAEVKTTLERESNNKYDNAAIRIMASVNGSAKYHLGYVPAEIAAAIAPIIDKVGELSSHLIGVVGGYSQRETLGGRLAIYL